MSMVVRSNINSMNANRNLGINNSQVAKAIEKLASGYAINRAADDASGLAITEKMQAQITGLDQGTDNALEGIGLVQTAEGAMGEIHDMLNRMVELATKAANGTISDAVDREAIQAEVDALVIEIDRIAESTNYNGIPLLTDSYEDILVNTLTKFYQVYDRTDVDITQTPSTGSATQYTGITTSPSSSSYKSSEIYKSSAITIPSEAYQNIPTNVTEPYEISYNITVYKDDLTDVNIAMGTTTPTIENITYGLIVEPGGGIYGTLNGVVDYSFNYATESYSTNYDIYIDPFGDKTDPANLKSPDTSTPYVSGSTISATEMTFIMEKIMNTGLGSYGLYAGGNVSYPTVSAGTPYPADTNGNGYPNFPSGYSYGDYTPSSSLSVSCDNDSVYDGSMHIYGTSTCQYRVIGTEVTVTSGGVSILNPSLDPVSTPAGFDHTEWDQNSDIHDLNNTIILDVDKVPEPTRTEGTISVPKTYDEVLAMTDEEREALIFTVSQTTTSSNNPDDVIEKTEQYVTLWEPFDPDEAATLFPGVNIIYGIVGEPEHYAIERLCDQIESDFTITATRKLDKTDDVSLDVNTTLKYVIQLGQYTQDIITYPFEDFYNDIFYTEDKFETVEDEIILHVADQNETYNKVLIEIDAMTAEALGIETLNMSTVETAGSAIQTIKDAINYASQNRANLGATQNRLEHTINGNNSTSENMTASKSRIKDADMAKEMMEYTKMNVLTQASQAMLAQSNQSTQQVLSLLE